MIHTINRKRTVAPFNKFYSKIWVAFCPNDTHREKLQDHFNTKLVKIESWLILIDLSMFTLAFKFYKFHCLILKRTDVRRKSSAQKTKIKGLLLYNKFYSKMLVGFWLNTEISFITKLYNNDQWKESNLNCKTVQRLFTITLLLTDHHLFICRLLKFKQSLSSILTLVFKKIKISFGKLKYTFLLY